MARAPSSARSAGTDVVVIGAGINGLVCALVLAKHGLSVHVVEDKAAPGGVHRADLPFANAPRLSATAATDVGLVPRDLEKHLGLTFPLRARAPARFVPTREKGRFLLTASGSDAFAAAAGAALATADDVRALSAMQAELDAIGQDLEPAWTTGPLPVPAVGERFVRAHLREAYLAVATGSLAAFVARFPLRSSLVKAAIAADALTGSFVAMDAPGSAAALLVRHATRLRGERFASGAALVRTLTAAAQHAGIRMTTGASVTQLVVKGRSVAGAILRDGSTIETDTVVASCDPFRLRALVGAERLPAEYVKRIDGFARAGAPAKLYLALSDLPRFTALPEDRGQHRAVTWLLPGEDDAVRVLAQAFADASAGRLPSPSPLEITFPSANEPELRDPEARHLASITVPFAPYDLTGTTWAAEEERFVSDILSVVESFAPGSRDLVVEAQLYHPKKLETQLGITRGHLRHVDDTILFGERLPYATAISGLYACGSACAPAGTVLGGAGWNAAKRILADVELGLERTEVNQRAREE